MTKKKEESAATDLTKGVSVTLKIHNGKVGQKAPKLG